MVSGFLAEQVFVYVCVRVCAFVAGTELIHLCVIMANQHVDSGHRGNAPVKRVNEGSVPSLCVIEKKAHVTFLTKISVNVWFCVMVINPT